MTDSGFTPAEKRGSTVVTLGLISAFLAVPWGIWFFFIWAYAGSDAYVNIAVLVVGPVIGTIAIFVRRLWVASALYVVVAGAEFLRPVIDTNDLFLVSGLVALIPLGMATACAYAAHRTTTGT